MKLPWKKGEDAVPQNEKSVPVRSMKLKQAMMMMKNYKVETYLARGFRDVVTTRVCGAIVTLSVINSIRMYYVLWLGDTWS